MPELQPRGPEKEYLRKNEGYVPPPRREGVRPSVQAAAQELKLEDKYKAYEFMYTYAEAGTHFSPQIIKKLPDQVKAFLGDDILDRARAYGGLKFKIKEAKRLGDDRKMKMDRSIEVYFATGISSEELAATYHPSDLLAPGSKEVVH